MFAKSRHSARSGTMLAPKARRVRKLTGERAADYDERRYARGAVTSQAPSWTGAAAAVALAALDAGCAGQGRARHLVFTLTNDGEWAQFVDRLEQRGPRALSSLASQVLSYHKAATCGVSATSAAARRLGGNIMRPLLDAAAPSLRVGRLPLVFEPAGPTTFHDGSLSTPPPIG